MSRNVILEKPATANLFELLELRDIAEEKHLILVEASTVNYFPVIRQIKKDLPLIGNVHIASCNFSQYSSRYDKFMSGEILPVFDPKKAGGALMDLNVYNINFMVGIFGRPSEITYFANKDKGIDTSGILIMDYIRFKGSCIAAKDCKGPTSVVIQGDKGYLYSNETMNKASSFKIVLNDGTQTDRTFKDDKHRLYYEFTDFIHIKEIVRYSSIIGLHTMLMCVGLNYVTYYLSDKGLSASHIGMVVSISCLIAVIAQQLTGRIVDGGKVDPKRLILLLSSILAIVGLYMSFFDTGALRPALFGLMLCITLAILPLLNSFTFYFIYVIRRAGGDSSEMGMAIGIAAVLEIPVLFLYTRIKGNRPSVYFLMTSGIAFLLKSILFVFAQNILMIYVIQLLQCMAYGLMAASRVYYVDELVGKENEATGQAYMSATETIGIVLGSALGGLIMQRSSVDILLTSGAAICLAGTLCMIISCLWTKHISRH